MMQGSIDHASITTKIRNVMRTRLLLVLLIIAVTSNLVAKTNTSHLQHSRYFIRALHYYVLDHTLDGPYWFGQTMVGYPIQQYYQMGQFNDFLARMQNVLGNLDSLTYCLLNQRMLNVTKQKLEMLDVEGNAQEYTWTLEGGFTEPFQIGDIQSIKEAFVQTQSARLELQTIKLREQSGKEHDWNLLFLIEPFSSSSIVVRLYAHEIVDLAGSHYWPFLLGLVLAAIIIKDFMVSNVSILSNIPYYFLCFFLFYSSILAFSRAIAFEFIFIVDGLTCLSAWLCLLKFYQKTSDYHLAFLIGQAYKMIGRLFISYAPLLIAFSLFGYCCFCRYSGQFSSLYKTFMSIFYICYYNMTYESIIVTSRSSFSMIFFILLVLIFTMCIYSGMLVSVFCSYVWGKREEQIKKDIEENLKIQCANCDHKYRYADSLKTNPKKSINMSQLLHIDFDSPEQQQKYKEAIINKIIHLRKILELIIEDTRQTYFQQQFPAIHQELIRQKSVQCFQIIQNLTNQLKD